VLQEMLVPMITNLSNIKVLHLCWFTSLIFSKRECYCYWYWLHLIKNS